MLVLAAVISASISLNDRQPVVVEKKDVPAPPTVVEKTPNEIEPKPDEPTPPDEHPSTTTTTDKPHVASEKSKGPIDRPRTQSEKPTVSIDKPPPNKSSAPSNKSSTPSGKSPPAVEWLDVLPLLDPNEDPAQRGTWVRESGGLNGLKYVAQPTTSGSMELPLTINGSYKLRMDFTAAGMGAGFGPVMTFPVGTNWVRLVLDGTSRHLTGLDRVKEQPVGDANNTTATTTLSIVRNKKCHLDLIVTAHRVGDSSVEVKVDNKPVFKWEGPATDLSLPSTVSKPPASLELLGFHAYTIHSLQLQSTGNNSSIRLPHPAPLGVKLPPFVREPRETD